MPGFQPSVAVPLCYRQKIPRPSPVDDCRKCFPNVGDTIHSFLYGLSFTNPHIPTNPVLEAALSHRVRSWNIDDGREGKLFEGITRLSAAISEFCYRHHDFDVKLQSAIFTWFMVYIDDELPTRMPEALQTFQERMHLGLPQLDPVMNHLVPCLSDMYLYFDRLCANSIIAATLEMINGTAMEVKKELAEMPLKLAALKWPYFLRTKTGIAMGYSLMSFPKRRHPRISAYFQAVADMNFFIDCTNDVLSFYKEEQAGEEGNYIQNRAKVSGVTPARVLVEVAGEALAARDRILAVLDGEPEALAAWKSFEQGYIFFHTSLSRYRLVELDADLGP